MLYPPKIIKKDAFRQAQEQSLRGLGAAVVAGEIWCQLMLEPKESAQTSFIRLPLALIPPKNNA
jgi:hypothetical protein